MRHAIFVIFFLLYLVPAWAQKLIILHTNDHHGAYMANASGENGLAAQATLVKQIREKAAREGNTVLVLSAGDINTGAPESNMFKAQPDIEAMNKIGYDAMVLGNHEFDLTPEELKAQQGQANFEFLAANIKHEDGSEAFTPYIIKDVQGKKIAIIGLTTNETPHMSSATNRPGLKWEDPVSSQKKLLKKLRAENDFVIALSHLGFFPDEAAGQEFPGDISLAKANPEIDIIIGGHSHTELQNAVEVGNTSIFQAKESGMYLGQIEVDLNGPKPKVKGKLLSVKNIIPDKEVSAILKPYLDRAGRELTERIGFLKGDLPGGRGKLKDQRLGNLWAESHKNYVNADFGVANSRSLRTGLKGGDVTLRDLLAVSPFRNTITHVEVNGEEIWRFMEIAHEKYLLPTDQNMSFTKNVELITEGNTIKEIRIGGKSISRTSTETYRMAMGNYIPEMVSDFEFLKLNPTYVNTNVDETESLRGFIKEHGELDAKKLSFNAHKVIDPCDNLFLKMK